MSKEQEVDEGNNVHSYTLEAGMNFNTADGRTLSLSQMPIKIPHDTVTDKSITEDKSSIGAGLHK